MNFDLLLISCSKYFEFEIGFLTAYVNTYSKGSKRSNKNKQKRNTFPLVSDVDVEESMFFCAELKMPYKQFVIFYRFMNTFLTFLLKLNNSYRTIPYVLAEV